MRVVTIGRGAVSGCGPGGCEPDANTAQPISSISMGRNIRTRRPRRRREWEKLTPGVACPGCCCDDSARHEGESE